MVAERNGRFDVSVVGLTPIHAPIQCVATNDGVPTTPELDDIAVQHFLDALAEVALAVVSRKHDPK